ncbi:hypothetical protein WMY93_022537 [Mugilogobius chulae]|uniref:DDE Tnp4 domain-containing protein n=1 Tax=Mugilogobius chulae TaxID=88201 RepID=A0AAW0N787_9GOBI
MGGDFPYDARLFCKAVPRDGKSAEARSRDRARADPAEHASGHGLVQTRYLREYRVVANQFGVHKSTVLKFMHAFCNGMLSSVIHRLIKVPTLDEARGTASSFEKKFNIPQVIGCIDSTHIPVLPPSDRYKDFVNLKGWPSYVLQAVVDDSYRFWNINCTMPGSCEDASVLQGSTLYEQATLLPKDPKDICGTSVGFFLLGDPAYPLTDWLMKDYSSTHITPQEESFNAYLSSARTTVETAFTRLKSRWRVLQKRSDFHFTFSPKVIATCCALHNFCEIEYETVNQTWIEELSDFEACKQPQPAQPPSDSSSAEGLEVRAALTQYLSQHFPLRTRKL